MTRGSYDINGRPTAKGADTSWKSCMCTMLVVLAIFLLIFFLIPWGKYKDDPDHYSNEYLNSAHSKAKPTTTPEPQKEKNLEKWPPSTKKQIVTTTEKYVTVTEGLIYKLTNRPDNEAIDVASTTNDNSLFISTTSIPNIISTLDEEIAYEPTTANVVTDKTPTTPDLSTSKSTTNVYDMSESTTNLYNVGESTTNVYNMRKSTTGVYDMSQLTTNVYNVGESTSDVSDVSESTTHVYDVSESTIDISDVSKSITYVYDVSESTIDVSDVNESTTDVSDISESTTEVYDVRESMTDVYNVSESTTNVYNMSEYTTDVNGVSESTTDVSNVIESTTDVYNMNEYTTDVNGVSESTTDVSNVIESTTDVSDVIESTTNVYNMSESTYKSSISTDVSDSTFTQYHDVTTDETSTELSYRAAGVQSLDYYDTITNDSSSTENREIYEFLTWTTADIATSSDVETSKHHISKRTADASSDTPSDKYSTPNLTEHDSTTASTKKKHANLQSTVCPKIMNETTTCNTLICKKMASRMLSLMSHENRPCEDFYTEACGGINDDYISEINVIDNVWKRISERLAVDYPKELTYMKKFKDYFKTCLHYRPSTSNTTAQIKELVAQIGEFYNKHADLSTFELTDLLKKLLMKNVPVLFDIQTNINDKKELSLVISPAIDRSIIQQLSGNAYHAECRQNPTVVNDYVNLTRMYEQFKKCQSNVSSYLKIAKEALILIDPFDGDAEEIDETMTALEQLTKILQKRKLSASEIKLIYSLRVGEYMSIEELKNELPLINWDSLLEISDKFYNDSSKVWVASIKDQKELFEIISTMDNRALNNAILAMYVHDLYRSYVLDQEIISDRNGYCLGLSSTLMQDISSDLYLKSFDAKDIKKSDTLCFNYFNSLIETLKAEIVTGSWLSDSGDKSNALKKLNSLRLYTVGKFAPWRNKDFLINRYDYKTFHGDFIIDTDMLENRYRELLYSLDGQDPLIPENMWSIIANPYWTKPTTILSSNIVVIPLAALYYQTNQRSIPIYFIMADLGFKLAKELNFYLEASGIPISNMLSRESKKDEIIEMSINSTYQGNPINIIIDLNSTISFEDRISDAMGAKLIVYGFRRFGNISQDLKLPIPWLNKTTEQLIFMHLTQQFCKKQPIIDSYESIFESADLHPLIRMNSMAINNDFFKVSYDCPKTEMNGGIEIKDVDDYYESGGLG